MAIFIYFYFYKLDHIIKIDFHKNLGKRRVNKNLFTEIISEYPKNHQFCLAFLSFRWKYCDNTTIKNNVSTELLLD